MFFVALIGFFLLVVLAFMEGNRNLKRKKLLFKDHIKKQYLLALSSQNHSILEKMKLGMKYYSLELGEGNATSSFEYIKIDINNKIQLSEFEAVYVIFLLAAFNPYAKQSYDDKNLKIAEILASWNINNVDVQVELKNACEFVIFNDGIVDIEKVFTFIDKEKHNSIALLACDIAMYGKNTEDYQEQFLLKLSKISESIKPIISESMMYFENRKKAFSINWSFQNGEHIATV